MGEPENVKIKVHEGRTSVPKGTTSGHYLYFITNTIDIMNKFPEIKGLFIIVESFSTHVSETTDSIINKREYTPVTMTQPHRIVLGYRKTQNQEKLA